MSEKLAYLFVAAAKLRDRSAASWMLVAGISPSPRASEPEKPRRDSQHEAKSTRASEWAACGCRAWSPNASA